MPQINIHLVASGEFDLRPDCPVESVPQCSAAFRDSRIVSSQRRALHTSGDHGHARNSYVRIRGSVLHHRRSSRVLCHRNHDICLRHDVVHWLETFSQETFAWERGVVNSGCWVACQRQQLNSELCLKSLKGRPPLLGHRAAIFPGRVIRDIRCRLVNDDENLLA